MTLKKMDDKRWHERRYHWVKGKEGRWRPEETNVGEYTVTKIAKLMDAILEAWTRCLLPPFGDGRFAPRNGVTYCNWFVNEVADKMGYDGFKGKGKYPILANEMYDKLKDDLKWVDVGGTSAQYYANHGYLVIASWKNPNGDKSGHVAIVRPGMMGTSKKWGIRIPGVPKVANVGVKDSCRLDRGANWAFGEKPAFFVFLKESSHG